MKAQFLIAIAENDDQSEPEAAVYNEAQAEKAWARLLVLFGKALA